MATLEYIQDMTEQDILRRIGFDTISTRELMRMKLGDGRTLRDQIVDRPYRFMSWGEILCLMRTACLELSRGTPEGDKYLMEFYGTLQEMVAKRAIERMGPEPYKKRI